MEIFTSIIAGGLAGAIVSFIAYKIYTGKIGKQPVLEFVSFNNATEAGQHVMGNVPGISETLAPHINKGGKFFGTLKKYPAKTDEDIEFMDRLF